MTPGCWYRISGDGPDLDLPPTPRGTRTLRDTDPAGDRALNPSSGFKERLRACWGGAPVHPGKANPVSRRLPKRGTARLFASRFGASGSMIVFGGGHDDYFGSSVHAFDISTRQWSRISDGYVSAARMNYGEGAFYPDAAYPDGSPLPAAYLRYVQYDPVGNDICCSKAKPSWDRR